MEQQWLLETYLKDSIVPHKHYYIIKNVDQLTLSYKYQLRIFIKCQSHMLNTKIFNPCSLL